MLHFAGFPLGVKGRVGGSCWRVPRQCSATSTPSNFFPPPGLELRSFCLSAQSPTVTTISNNVNITLIFLIRYSGFSVVYFSLVFIWSCLSVLASCLFVHRVLSFVFLNVQLDVDIILVWFQNEPPQHSLAMLRLRCPVSI